MSFDDDIRNRFSNAAASVDDVDGGAAAAEHSSRRRTAVTRAAVGGTAIVAILIGFFALSNLGDDQTEVQTADPTPTVAPDTTAPDTMPGTTPDSVPGTTTPGEASATGIATVDVDGVVRINSNVVDATEWLPKLEASAAEPSVGPDGYVLVTEEVAGCTRISIVDDSGEQVTDHPVSTLSRCISGELADWSSAGHVVLVSPTQEDAWSLTVLAADGRSAQLTSPGAFQPLQLDVHTDANGRTEALILGTGEELVYVDVDAFLATSEKPEVAVLGISNETNLISAQFVDGVEQNPLRAQLDEVIAAHSAPPDPPVLPAKAVWAVTGVEANDTLNARSGPGIEFGIVFELAPDATGVVQVGEANSTDGALWFEVYAPNSGTGVETGWVNSAFLTETPVADARPCLFNGPQDHYIGFEWTNPDGSPDSDAAVISNIETYRFGGCIRTVIEFSDGWSYEEGGANRVTTLPHDIRVIRDVQVIVDLGRSIEGAEVAESRLSESNGVNQSIFMVKDAGPDHVVGYLFSPTTTTTATFDNTNGTVIIDIADIRLPSDADPAAIDQVGAAVEPIVDSNGLVVTRVRSRSDDGNRWSFAGFARPFEANLTVSVRTSSDQAIDVEWFGAVVEGHRSDNGVMTTAYIDAWGQFDFSITLPDGVDPGDVVIVFDPSGGGADDVQTVDLPLADFLG